MKSLECFVMTPPVSSFGSVSISPFGWVRVLPCGPMMGFLRRAAAPLQITLQRLPAAVAAKQNGFWQIVS